MKLPRFDAIILREFAKCYTFIFNIRFFRMVIKIFRAMAEYPLSDTFFAIKKYDNSYNYKSYHFAQICSKGIHVRNIMDETIRVKGK